MSSSRLPDPEMGNAPNPNMTESGGRSLFPVSEYFSRPQPAHPPPFDRSTKPSAGRQSANSPPRPTVIQGGPSENIPIRPIPPPIPPHVHGPSNTTDAQPRPQTQHEGRQNVESPSDTSPASPDHLASFVTKMDLPARYDPEAEVKAAGKSGVSREKVGLIAGLATVNFVFIFATWWWPRYYYIYLPFITLTVFLNSVMVFSVLFFALKRKIKAPKKIIPTQPETLVFVVPCYNETPEELTRSLDSLADQTGIDQHPRAMMIICDGKVRGPGMEKSTAEYLLEDLLEPRSRKYIKGAYTAWDRKPMDVEVQSGFYKGLPYYCIIKQQNQGKRDSLIALRSFLYNFNIRNENPQVIFSPQFFGEMASYLIKEGGMENVTHLIGMDADTVFADDCISELLKESYYPHTIGVCGYVAVDFTRGGWGLWNLYQSAEYTISQGLRRFHQSTVTHKVSCLPGCCQLLRVCETTCGNRILIDLFGYCPKPTDSLLKHIRATASEDRNHVCLMLSAFPKAQTRQALRARAFTDVPHSWSVFLSQRRRWTLGATSNDLLLVVSPGIFWFERILAFANCLVWCVNIFVFASLANLIAASIKVAGWIILCFSAVMLVPLLYYFCIVFWIPRTAREKIQYIMGCCIYVTCGPFINIIVLLYAVFNVDSFGWGKTRKVISVVDAETNDVAVPVTIDEEADIGLRQPRPKVSKKDKVVILGSDTYAQQLLKAFGTHYKTIAYDPEEEVASRIRQQFSGAENYSIETTSDEEQLATANIYLIAAPAARPGSSHHDRNAHIHHLTQAIATVTRHFKPGDIVMIESAVSVGTTRTLLADLSRRGAICGFSPAPLFMPTTGRGAFTSATKTISVLTPTSLLPLENIYRPVFPSTTTAPTPEIAELLTLLSTAQRESQSLLNPNFLKNANAAPTATPRTNLQSNPHTSLQSNPHTSLQSQAASNLSAQNASANATDQLYLSIQTLTSLYKEFVLEAESGLEILPPPPHLSSSVKTTPGQGTPPTPSPIGGDSSADDSGPERADLMSAPPMWGLSPARNGSSIAPSTTGAASGLGAGSGAAAGFGAPSTAGSAGERASIGYARVGPNMLRKPMPKRLRLHMQGQNGHGHHQGSGSGNESGYAGGSGSSGDEGVEGVGGRYRNGTWVPRFTESMV